MTQNKKLHNAGMIILKTIGSGCSAIRLKFTSKYALNIPSSAAANINRYLKSNRNHEIYGSLAMSTHSMVGRKPSDIDIVVKSPKNTARAIIKIMKKHKIETKLTSNPMYGSFVVQVKKKGIFVDAVDIHPLKSHRGKFQIFGKSIDPVKVNGYNIQHPADQLRRKANSVMAKDGPPAHRKLKDNTDFVTTSRLLLDAKELRARAELKRVKQAREKLKLWKKHVRSLPGYSKTKTVMGKDPISAKNEKLFIKYALEHPGIDVTKIKITKMGISITKPKKKTTRKKVSSPYKKKSTSKKKIQKKEEFINIWDYI